MNLVDSRTQGAGGIFSVAGAALAAKKALGRGRSGSAGAFWQMAPVSLRSTEQTSEIRQNKDDSGGQQDHRGLPDFLVLEHDGGLVIVLHFSDEGALLSRSASSLA
jgi:hypothetical protein